MGLFEMSLAGSLRLLSYFLSSFASSAIGGASSQTLSYTSNAS